MNEPEERWEFRRLIRKSNAVEVWEAYDRGLQRPNLVKKISPEYARDPELRPRFEREGQAAAQISHPNVVQIHERLWVGDELWLIFEWVDGRNIGELLHNHGLFPVQVAAAIAGGILSGLEGAHGAGVLHRDLTPANVMVSSEGKVKITDFGLATLKDRAALALTQQGLPRGTSQYLSPEQFQAEPLTEASDLFATGLILFEMLTGRPVHEGQTAHEVLEHVQRYKPPRLDAYGDAMPSEIQPVLARLLQKSPSDRYATAQEAREALEAAVGGFYSPVLIADTLFGKVEHKPAIRPSAKVSRRRWLVPILIIAFLALVAVAVLSVLLREPPHPPPPIAYEDPRIVPPNIVMPPEPTIRPETTISSALPDSGWVRLWCKQAAVALIDSVHSVAVGLSDTLLTLGPPYGRRELTFARSEIGFDVKVPFETRRGDTSELRVDLYDHVGYLSLWCKQQAVVHVPEALTETVGRLDSIVGAVVPVGSYEITFVRREIESPIPLKISIAARKTTRVRVDLDTLIARVWVASVRPWPAAEVWVDGIRRFATPSQETIFLMPGRHRIVLYNQANVRDSVVWQDTVFAKGDTIRVRLDRAVRQ